MALNHVQLSGNDAALFVSDIHLCDDEIATAEHFFSALKQWASAHTHIFILGDLFESWCGDDVSNDLTQRFIAIATQLVNDGKRLYLMRGNRDFLIDVAGTKKSLALTKQLGATLLADETRLDAFGTPWLLCHGDQLCTLDADYQLFRQQSRSEQWQQDFLRKSVDDRLRQAAAMRHESKLHQSKILNGSKTANPSHSVYDVVASAALDLMNKFEVRHLLHGHTHLPAIHRLDGDALRHVLSDWGPSRGDAFSLTSNGAKRLSATLS
jgi:UDP-2,3-diacylglucosamine hydrolase